MPNDVIQEGKYIKHFLPVLKDMPKQYIFAPWTAPLEIQQKANCIIGRNTYLPKSFSWLTSLGDCIKPAKGVDYPNPVVDHAVAMNKNMQQMKLAYAGKLTRKLVGKDACGEEAEEKAFPQKTASAFSKPEANGTKRKRATSEKETKKTNQLSTSPVGRARPLKRVKTE